MAIKNLEDFTILEVNICIDALETWMNKTKELELCLINAFTENVNIDEKPKLKAMIETEVNKITMERVNDCNRLMQTFNQLLLVKQNKEIEDLINKDYSYDRSTPG